MSKFRFVGVLAVALVAVLALSACGKSKKAVAGKTGGTVTIVFGTAPDSLDPGMNITTQGAEADQIVYVGLYTYAAANGPAGSKLIPGLATAFPKISADGKTYTLFLRKGLRFSNGKPVHASDFTWAVKRALKIPWGLSSFLTANVIGAADYANGKANTISGITTDDATGKITIHLIAPYGAFENVLAFWDLSPVPTGTPLKNMPTNPPPGVGPYKIVDIVPNVSYSVVKNKYWKPIAGVPSGYVNRINAKISSNTTANALAVLNNSADVFDWGDTIPPSLLSQIQSKAAGRYSTEVRNATYYFFLNQRIKPFSSQLAREAVMVGLDRQALVRLGSGFFVPGCYFLPSPMIGHPTAPCPYGDPTVPQLAKAKALVRQSGMAGTPITVWGEERVPRRQFVDYYTSFLNQIGFKATEKIIADATYFPTIGNPKLNAQTGFDDYNQDFPNPIDFYGLLMAGDAILPANNLNHSLVNDPFINARVNMLGSLYKVPSSDLAKFAGQWQALDVYAAKKVYNAVWGYLVAPKFVSDRINQSTLVFQPTNGWLWSTFQLKK